MTDYAKKTNKELSELLAARSLPTSGKKAELVARLQESDEANATGPQTSTSSAPAPMKQAPEPPKPQQSSSEAASSNPPPATAAAAAAAASTAKKEPTPSTAVTTTDSTTKPTDPSSDATNDATLAAAVTFSMNLPTSSIDEELRKRRSRAERFGAMVQPPPASSTDANGSAEAQEPQAQPDANAATDLNALKALERAKRFGTTPSSTTGLGTLDSALPEERERARGGGRGGLNKRGTPTGDAFEDPGLKKRRLGGSGGSGVHRGQGQRGARGGGGRAPVGVVKTGGGGGERRPAAFTNDADRTRAEERKKRWAS